MQSAVEKAPADRRRHVRTRPQAGRGCRGSRAPTSGHPPLCCPSGLASSRRRPLLQTQRVSSASSPLLRPEHHDASQVGSSSSSEIGFFQTPWFRAAELAGVVVNINTMESGTRQISSFANLLLIVSLIKKLLIIMFITSNNCSAIKHGLSGINGELERK